MVIPTQNKAIVVLVSTLASILFSILVFPELWIYGSIPFLIPKYDYEYNFASVYLLIQNWQTGWIQLWNAYDQIPNAFLHLAGGIYTPDHIATAVITILYAKLTGLQSSEGFYRIFTIVFFSVNTLFRSVLGYYFLKRFTKNATVLGLSLVILNTLLTPHMVQGFGFVFVYSCLLLAMGLILDLWEDKKSVHKLVLGAAFIFSLSPLFSLSYFYLAIHCFLAAVLVWWFFYKPKFKVSLRSKPMVWVFVIGCAALLVLPSVWMLLSNWKDYDFAKETSRFNHIFSISEYFTRAVFFADQKFFFSNFLNPLKNDWGYSWLYFGFLPLILAIIGGVQSKDSRKWIFIMMVGFFYLMNSSRTAGGLNAFFHWFHALSSPLKFLPRSFHMTGVMMFPFVLIPLITLGLEALHQSFTKRTLKGVGVILWGIVLLANYGLRGQSKPILYWFLGLGIASVGLFLLSFKRSRLAVICLLFVALLDTWGERQYFKKFVDEVQSLPAVQVSEIMSPFKYHAPRQVSFGIPKSSDAVFRQYGQSIVRGLFLETVFLGKLYHPSTQYQPRHVAYQSLSENPEFEKFLNRPPSLFYWITPSEKPDKKIEPISSDQMNWSRETPDHWTFQLDWKAGQTLMVVSPYDSGWRVLLNQKEAATRPVFKSFLGVEPGFENSPSAVLKKIEVDLHYWPNSLLRFLIGVSGILGMAVFFQLTGFRLVKE